MKGWIYFAVNPSLRGLIKIGFTERDPLKRVSELSNTSIPHKFELIYSALVEKADEVEFHLHRELNKFRTSASREFFECDVIQAKNSLVKTLGYLQVHVLYEEKDFEDGNDGYDCDALTVDSALEIVPKLVRQMIRQRFKRIKESYGKDPVEFDSIIDVELLYLSAVDVLANPGSSWAMNLPAEIIACNKHDKSSLTKELVNRLIINIKGNVESINKRIPHRYLL